MVGNCRGEEAIILIDNEASYNFISPQLVEHLGIPTLQVTAYEVSVRDSYKVKGNKTCLDVLLEIQGMRVIQSFHIFDLGGADMVLGIEWLKSLGEVKVNWGN